MLFSAMTASLLTDDGECKFMQTASARVTPGNRGYSISVSRMRHRAARSVTATIYSVSFSARSTVTNCARRSLPACLHYRASRAEFNTASITRMFATPSSAGGSNRPAAIDSQK